MRRWMLCLLLGWCLALPPGAAHASADPLEPFNRAMFAFNGQLVSYVINPVADLLERWTPASVRAAGARVYDNLTEPEFIVTNLFKGHNVDAGVSATRFLVNTTLGVGGLFDPATGMGLIRRETEFGESLCAAGIPTGPYVVLPAIGPANAVSAGLITGFFAVEWYVLSLISTVLATADLVVDISASAASLRHADELPDMANADPYLVQRAEYLRYLETGCTAAHSPAPANVAERGRAG